MKTVYVIGTCDTKEAELRYAVERAGAAGAAAVLVDISTTPSTARADFTPEMAFPHRILTNFFAHEHLQKQITNRLHRRMWDQQFDDAAALFHIHPQTHQQYRAIGAGNLCKARIALQSVELE